MTRFIRTYQLDFQLRDISYLKLGYSSSDNFPTNELEIIEQFYPIVDVKTQGCFYDFTPRQLRITYTNQEWLQFINPFRGNTPEYLAFFQLIESSNGFSKYEIIPERVPHRYLDLRFTYG